MRNPNYTLRMQQPGIFVLAFSMLAVAGCDGQKRPNPSGTLEATEVEIASTIPGRVVLAAHQLGGQVSAGDTLALIDTEIIRLQRAQAEAGLGSINAQRSVLRDGIAQAGRNLEYLELQQKRIEELVAHGTAQQQQFDEISTRRDVAKSQLDASKHQIAALDAEEGKVEAALAVFDRQIEEGVITAPLSGEVLLKAIEAGEVATPGKVLFRLANLDPMELRVFIGAEDLGRVKIGATVQVVVDALPDRKLAGTVTWVSTEAEFTPKNAQTKDARLQMVYAVKISVANADRVLKIGMPAEALL